MAQQIWEQRYTNLKQGSPEIAWPHDPWLERWQHLLDSAGAQPVLELGCGRGLDARYLSEQGRQVIAADFSANALQIAQQIAPQANLLQLNLIDGLPFAPATFPIIIASLCLHYFLWATTKAILQRLHTCLQPDGRLLLRVNSTRDLNHGAGGPAAGYAELEPHFYLVQGVQKRFFDRVDLLRLLESQWQIVALEELTIMHRLPKVLWEVVVQP